MFSEILGCFLNKGSGLMALLEKKEESWVGVSSVGTLMVSVKESESLAHFSDRLKEDSS
jgi:hypothetical protein